MSEASPFEMQRLLGAEFERRGWEYDLNVGRDIVGEALRTGEINGTVLARRVSAEFLARAGATRQDVADAIDHALGGRSPKREEPAPSVMVINDHRYSINMGSGGSIVNSNLNVGDGTQINVDAAASREDVLAAVDAILRAALEGNWNRAAASDLAEVISARDDIALEDISQVTADVVRRERPRRERAKELLTRIAVDGIGGALGTGIAAGLGEVIGQLPM